MDARNIGHGPGLAAPDAPPEPQIVEGPAFAAPGPQGNDQNNCAGILTRVRTAIKRWVASLRDMLSLWIWDASFGLSQRRQAQIADGRHWAAAASSVGLALLHATRWI